MRYLHICVGNLTLWTTVEALDSANLKEAEIRQAKRGLGECFRLGFEMLRQLSGMPSFLLVPTVFVQPMVIADLRPKTEEFTLRGNERRWQEWPDDLEASVRQSFGTPIELLGVCLRTKRISKENGTVAEITRDCPVCLKGEFLVLLSYQGIEACASNLHRFLRESTQTHERFAPLGSKPKLRVPAGAYVTIPEELATKILLEEVFLHEQGHACSLSTNSYKEIEQLKDGTATLVHESVANYLAYIIMERLLDTENLSLAWRRFLEVSILLEPEPYQWCGSWIQAHEHGRQKVLSELVANVREDPRALDWDWLRGQILHRALG